MYGILKRVNFPVLVYPIFSEKLLATFSRFIRDSYLLTNQGFARKTTFLPAPKIFKMKCVNISLSSKTLVTSDLTIQKSANNVNILLKKTGNSDKVYPLISI